MTDAGYCRKCQDTIKVVKKQRGGLTVKCSCGIARNIKVSRATPDSWNL